MSTFQHRYLEAIRRDDGLTALSLLMTEIERVSQLPCDCPDTQAAAQRSVAETVAQMRAVLDRARQKIEAGDALTLNEIAMVGVIGVQLGRVETFAYSAAMPMIDDIHNKFAGTRPN